MRNCDSCIWRVADIEKRPCFDCTCSGYEPISQMKIKMKNKDLNVLIMKLKDSYKAKKTNKYKGW